MTEGVVASYQNFKKIPTDIFSIYNFVVLGLGGVLLARAVLYNQGLVPNFLGVTRRSLRKTRKGIFRTLANAAIFGVVMDSWSQALQFLNAKPVTTPYYVAITEIFPRYPWEGRRYGELGAIFAQPAPPFNFPLWFNIWIAVMTGYFAIDFVRLYGSDLGRIVESLFLRILPVRVVGALKVSTLGKSYLRLRGYAEITFRQFV